MLYKIDTKGDAYALCTCICIFFEKKPGQFYLQIKMYSVCIYLLVYNQELSVNVLNLSELSFF